MLKDAQEKEIKFLSIHTPTKTGILKQTKASICGCAIIYLTKEDSTLPPTGCELQTSFELLSTYFYENGIYGFGDIVGLRDYIGWYEAVSMSINFE